MKYVPWIFNQLNNSLYAKARCTQSSVLLGMASTLRMPTTISPGSKSHELNQHGLAPDERVSFPLPSDLLERIGFCVLHGYSYYRHISQTSPKYEVILLLKKKKCLTCCTIACPEPKYFQVLYEFLSLHHSLPGPILVSRYPSTIKKNPISSAICISVCVFFSTKLTFSSM